MRFAALCILVAACSSSSAPAYYVPPGCEACVSTSTGAKPGTQCCTLNPNDPAHEVNFCADSDCVPLDAGSDAKRD